MEFKVGRSRVFAATGGQAFDPDRPAVIFVHGAGNDHTVWHGPSRYFAYHGRSVLAFDLPGHGRSGGKALSTIEDMASWLVRAIDAIGIDRVAIAGHSMGGLIALGLTRLTYGSFRYQFAEFDSLLWLPNNWVVGGVLTACAIGMMSAVVSVRRELGRAYAT